MNILELNHVALHVSELEATSHFYESVLRLEKLPRPDFSFPGAWFKIGSSQELHLIGERDADVINHPRGDHFAVMVDDIEAWAEHLRENEVEFKGPNPRPDGAFQIFLADPDGHVVELCQAAK